MREDHFAYAARQGFADCSDQNNRTNRHNRSLGTLLRPLEISKRPPSLGRKKPRTSAFGRRDSLTVRPALSIFHGEFCGIQLENVRTPKNRWGMAHPMVFSLLGDDLRKRRTIDLAGMCVATNNKRKIIMWLGGFSEMSDSLGASLM